MQSVIALIAHDSKKREMLAFCVRHRAKLSRLSLVATGNTGAKIAEATGLPVECVLPGPSGGDLQIAARVAIGEVGMVIFFADSSGAARGEPDANVFIRICSVQNVPLALNVATAELILR